VLGIFELLIRAWEIVILRKIDRMNARSLVADESTRLGSPG
jgi:hypothetical protein